MKRPVLATLLFAATIFSINLASIVTPRVHADTLTTDDAAVVITASCFDEANGVAYWQVTNPSTTTAGISWTTSDSSTSGQYDAPVGTTDLTTIYDATQPMQDFIFSQEDADDTTLVVPQVACAETEETPQVQSTEVATETEPEEACVDGSNRANLDFDSATRGIVNVYTATGAPLCDDVTVYLSAYTLPADYDHSGIFDDSAIPQQLFSSDSVVLHKGTNGYSTLTVAVPDACTDYQLDLYYAPEITTVTGAGHGTQLIYGNIILGDPTDPSCSGGMGGGPVETPPTDTPVETVATTSTTTLADTGSQTWIVSIIASVLLAGGVAIRFGRMRLQQA
jgi:hypothetical protein